MQALVVGSAAAVNFNRDIRDIDYIATMPAAKELLNWHKVENVKPRERGNKLVGFSTTARLPIEIELAWPESTGAELLELAEQHKAYSPGLLASAATSNVILALKLSHRYRKNSLHFIKTMRDIQHLRKQGVVVPGWLQPWLKKREKETLSYQHPDLNQSSRGFFTNNVPYRYVHDTIHIAMSRNGIPAYSLYQADGAEVKVDRGKWERLSFEDKLAGVIEEAYVLALERHQIPNNFTPEPLDSFLIALEKVCTSIASGWWREWAWENYDAAVTAYDSHYVDRCKAAIADGTIRPYVP